MEPTKKLNHQPLHDDHVVSLGSKQEQDWATILDILIRQGNLDFCVSEKATTLTIQINGDGGRALMLKKSGAWSLE